MNCPVCTPHSAFSAASSIVSLVPPGAVSVTVTLPSLIGMPSLSSTVALSRTLSPRFGVSGV